VLQPKSFIFIINKNIIIKICISTLPLFKKVVQNFGSSLPLFKKVVQNFGSTFSKG
jgi:putative transposon-encoded protein